MRITGLSLDDFRECVRITSDVNYSGNIIVHGGAHDTNTTRNRETGVWQQHCTARLSVIDSHGPGSRTSWRGRHGPYACWCAYRDVLSEVFQRFPNAVIVSGNSWRVTYRGQQGFYDSFPATGEINVGSLFEPVTMPELCDCTETLQLESRRSHQRRIEHQRRMEAISERGYYAAGETTTDQHTEFRGTRGQLSDDILGSTYDYYEYVAESRDRGSTEVSEALRNARTALTAGAELLDKPLDSVVFGPEYRPESDQKSYDYHIYPDE